MKILLLGLSGSGKSTVSKLLAKKYNLNLVEADDEVEKANGGIWPIDDANSDSFIDRIFEETNKRVINSDNVVYVISWLEKERIKEFYDRGFIIIEMHADFEELLKRKEQRDGASNVRCNKFSNTYTGYFETILSTEMKNLYTLSLDTTNLPTNEILSAICNRIDNSN